MTYDEYLTRALELPGARADKPFENDFETTVLRHGEGVFLDDYTVEQVEQALARPLVVSETDGYALCDAIFPPES